MAEDHKGRVPGYVRSLSAMQDLFCRNMASTGKKQQSAIDAGYAISSAGAQASRLLRIDKIIKSIDYYKAASSQRVNITADMVLAGIHSNAVRCAQGEPVLNAEGEEIGVWRFDSSGSNKAWELLGKHLRLFVDRIETADINAAKEYIEKLLVEIFKVVKDKPTQDKIMKVISDMDDSDGAVK